MNVRFAQKGTRQKLLHLSGIYPDIISNNINKRQKVSSGVIQIQPSIQNFHFLSLPSTTQCLRECETGCHPGQLASNKWTNKKRQTTTVHSCQLISRSPECQTCHPLTRLKLIYQDLKGIAPNRFCMLIVCAFCDL